MLFCLNKYAQKMPPNTAPAGYTCPCCKSGMFPAQNVVSPIAEALRQHLSKVNWHMYTRHRNIRHHTFFYLVFSLVFDYKKKCTQVVPSLFNYDFKLNLFELYHDTCK
jgi:hypothetical protein